MGDDLHFKVFADLEMTSEKTGLGRPCRNIEMGYVHGGWGVLFCS